MKRYRVESKSNKNHFKAVCKHDANENKGKCYYREFPVTKNKKVYYSEENEKLTVEELAMITKRLKVD